MKIGDRVKGFEFAEQRRALFVAMTTPMYNLIGVDGTIVEIDHDNGTFKIEFGNKNVDNGTSAWWYPINEYLVILREDKLKELGIR
jgi:hypothetical protein